MGFFSSRRAEDSDAYMAAPSTSTSVVTNDKSVVHVIRSRFYGKNKGKEREEPPVLFSSSGASVAQTLSHPGPSAHVPITSSKLSIVTGGVSPSILRVLQDEMSMPPIPPKGLYPASNMGPPSPSSFSSRSGSAPFRNQKSDAALTKPRRTADTVTLTLAQRLNDLAVANSEGLLDDDEYRLLRQNLFERFATSTIVPCETPVVPVSRPRPPGDTSTVETKSLARPLSNFQIEVDRSPSIRSKTSVSSGVAHLFRRATGRRTPAGSRDYSETSSILSTTSKTSNFFRRGLSRASSNSSMRTTISRPQIEAISISGASSGRISPDHSTHPPSSASRSNVSIRKLASPPSSFPSRVMGNESSRHLSYTPDVVNDEHSKSAAEIRQEILAVEAEAKRVMDAFNGLEMTSLANVRRHQNRIPVQEVRKHRDSSPLSMLHDGQSQRRVTIVENDVVSIRSGISTGTMPSMIRSPQPVRKARVKGGSNGSASLVSTGNDSLRRKNSASSVGSQERRGGRSNVPPVPTLPSTYNHLAGSTSNISLARSTGHLPMSAQPENGLSIADTKTEEQGRIENEMDDIRKRREEVSGRYDARLEYLRAKLKGAELHEKLARR